MPEKSLKLFVNYRRADEAAFVQLLWVYFTQRYGRDDVFMDLEIPYFTQFEDYIKEKIRDSDVVVVIIGPKWLELLRAKAASGETDYVLLEIRAALRLGKVIAPILIQGAGAPPLSEIPEDIRKMFRFNIPELRHGRELEENVLRRMSDCERERELKRRGVVRKAEASEHPPSLIEGTTEQLSMDELTSRFVESITAEDYPSALLWATEMQAIGSVPESFKLEQRIATIQEKLHEIEETRRRREVAVYLYGFVRHMVALDDPQDEIFAALDEVWAIEPDYHPDNLVRLKSSSKLVTEIRPQIASTPSSVSILLPPFVWIDIPAGKVTLETNKTFDVPAFAIAKYPITNAQFAKFVEAGGYSTEKWWTPYGWKLRQAENWTQPRFWDESQYEPINRPHHPVVGVSWFEAVAFCLWLSDSSGEKVMLPTEQMWQRAAQGDDGRAYPWGNKWDGKRCQNSVKPFSSGNTSPVTDYEGRDKGDSPFGVTDMAGNVWEWCLTDYQSGYQELNINANYRVLRGGSWGLNDTGIFRAALRDWLNPSYGNFNLGFRCARSR